MALNLSWRQLKYNDSPEISKCSGMFSYTTPSEKYDTPGAGLSERMQYTKKPPTAALPGYKLEQMFELWGAFDQEDLVLAVALDRSLKRVNHSDPDSPCLYDLWCVSFAIDSTCDPKVYTPKNVYESLRSFLYNIQQGVIGEGPVKQRVLGLVWRDGATLHQNANLPSNSNFPDAVFYELTKDVNLAISRAKDNYPVSNWNTDLSPENAYRHFKYLKVFNGAPGKIHVLKLTIH